MENNNDSEVIVKEYSKKKSPKLKKTILKLTAVGLSLALASASVIIAIKGIDQINSNYSDDYYSNSDSNNEDDFQDSTISNNYQYIDDDIAFKITPGEDPYVEKTYPNIMVKTSKESYEDYVRYLSSLDSTYSYENLYGIDEAISKYKKNSDIVVHSQDITNGSGILDVNVLYEQVLKNNEATLKDTSNLENNFYEKLPSSTIMKVCEYLVESINKELENNPEIDAKEVYCNLYDLKILGHIIITANAYYNESNVLVVSPENIEDYKLQNTDVDAFRQVIHHEGNHVIQSGCKDNELKNEVELGICHKYNDLKMNPFYWSWFLEASAEKQMAKTLGEDTNTYSAPIGYYDSIILCTILNKNVSVSDVENISYEKKSESLFQAFNATTKEEKLEIVKMMYSTEIMQSAPSDFYDLYKEVYGIDLYSDTNELENLRLNLRIDILKTLSKEFYKSLSSQLVNGNLSLDTIYYLINVYEADVFIHLFYNEKARIASGVEFFDFYTELQNEFFKMLEPYVEYSFDELVGMFNNYSMNVKYNGTNYKNYSLDNLGSEDANFIEKKRIQNYQTGIPTIRSMPEYCLANGYSK